jgi:MFS family permease
MIPYTVIKEANRPEHSGTATGVINFLNFAMTAILGPLFAARLTAASAGGERELGHYQATFTPLLFGVAIAILLTFLLRETGPRARSRSSAQNREFATN